MTLRGVVTGGVRYIGGWTYQRDVRMELEEIHRGRRYRMYRYVKGSQGVL